MTRVGPQRHSKKKIVHRIWCVPWSEIQKLVIRPTLYMYIIFLDAQNEEGVFPHTALIGCLCSVCSVRRKIGP
jgi:hypothetical protein